ncbi:hypothetical protein LEM8419_02369 [Neolewinella maritima]|uniref:Uncharacterized protein n=1 Tax=Neolewinella maritima TaxID=1383882 RepID=A0ABM9B2M9_9BACT|nr:hypothetical protein [Neolewinella maritima]CAH1001466.1 hypothetical protein LEM8419_02369 [Neolewinella maritima]
MFVRSLPVLLLSLLLSSPLTAQTCRTIASRVGINEQPLFAPAGSTEADFRAFYLSGAVVPVPLRGSLSRLPEPDSLTTYRRGIIDPADCHAIPDTTTFEPVRYTLVPDKSATVTFRQSVDAIDRISFTVFRDGYDPAADNCPDFLTSSFVLSGNTPSLTVDLVGGVTYVLVVAAGQAPTDTIPFDYTIEVSNETGTVPTFYRGTPPTDDTAYTYLAVQRSVVVAASETADFRTLARGAYDVYGLSYGTKDTEITQFIGGSLDDIRTDPRGRPRCTQLSDNAQDILIQ